MFRPGGKAEIIRSQQKDEFYLTYLRGLIADVIHSLFGKHATKDQPVQLIIILLHHLISSIQ